MGGTVDDMADCYVNIPNLVNSLKAMGFTPKDSEGMTFREAMIASQIASAVKGDKRAYENIMAFSKKNGTMPLEEFVKWNGACKESEEEKCQEIQNKTQTSKNSRATKAVKKPRKTAERAGSLRGKREEKKMQ